MGLFLGTYVVGPSLMPFKDEIDPAVLAQAVRAVAGKTGTPLLTVEQAQTEMKAYMTKRQAGLAQRNREEGAKFLAGNKTKPGVITTPSGLQYMVLRQGNGQRPMPTSRVRVNYEGKLLNGEVFDSSYARGEPAEFPLNGVIAGWTEGVSLMPVGAKYRFWIPSNLAYGEGGAPGVNELLQRLVERLPIKCQRVAHYGDAKTPSATVDFAVFHPANQIMLAFHVFQHLCQLVALLAEGVAFGFKGGVVLQVNHKLAGADDFLRPVMLHFATHIASLARLTRSRWFFR